ncbi:hypothetical protein GCM10022209_23770 [Chitinophaga oryziterrae]
MLFAAMLTAFAALAQKEEPLAKNALEAETEGRLLARLDYIHAFAYPYFGKMSMYNNKPTIYIPYVDGDSNRVIVCTSAAEPKVVYSVAFTEMTKTANVITSHQVRDFTSTERELYTMIERTVLEAKRDSFFHFPENAYAKFRPIITPFGHKLYLYADPVKHDKLYFGDDFVLEFDKDNRLMARKQLHKYVYDYGLHDRNLPDTVFGYHSHTQEDNDDFTATDICKILYYQTIAGWNNFVVEGNHFLTFWDYKKDRAVRYDKDEFVDYYTNKPYHGKHLVLVQTERQDSGQIPLTTEMQQIATDGLYLANLSTITIFATHHSAKQGKLTNQNLHAVAYMEGHICKLVFFKEANFGKAFATVSFDERYDSSYLKTEYQSRNFTPYERKLYQMYVSAIDVIKDYNLQKRDTSVHFIIQPVISGSSKKVYVTTESNDPGKLIFGNDFYIEFAKNKDYLKIIPLHNTAEFLTQSNNISADTLLGIHSHFNEADDFLTATDISKLARYRLRAGWSHFVVRGKTHLCFWNFEKAQVIYWDAKLFKSLYTGKPYHGKIMFL